MDLNSSNRALQHSLSSPAMRHALGVIESDASTSASSSASHRSSVSHSNDKQKRSLNQRLKDNVVKITPSSYQCKFFCGGLKCRFCTNEQWTQDEQAINGLYSHWVTDNLLAMARPTCTAVESYGIVQQFLDNGIASIINLQHAAEHKWCGPPLDACGFSYNVELFMKHGIFHYNFGWPDFGVTSVAKMLDMVKVMSFALQQGRVAVHCHAGLGRTGVLMACYLIWSREMHPKEAVLFVRKKRPNSIQNQDQVDLVYNFADFLKPIRLVFNSELNFLEYVALQQHALHGVEARVLKHLPKIVYVVCERVNELFGHTPQGTLQRKLTMLAAGDDVFYEKLLANQPRLSEDDDEQTSTVHMIKQLSDHMHSNVRPSTCQLPPASVSSQRLPPIDTSHVNKLDNDLNATATHSTSEDCVFTAVLSQLLMRYLPSVVDAQVLTYTRTMKQFTLCWEELADETNALLLLAVLGKWFQNLKEPLVKTDVLMPDESHFNAPKQTIKPSQKWTILYLCSSMARWAGTESSTRHSSVALLCDWLTWSRDEKAEAYFLSCLSTIDSNTIHVKSP